MLRAWEHRARPAAGRGGLLGEWCDRARHPVFKERERAVEVGVPGDGTGGEEGGGGEGRAGVGYRLATRGGQQGRRGTRTGEHTSNAEDGALVEAKRTCWQNGELDGGDGELWDARRTHGPGSEQRWRRF